MTTNITETLRKKAQVAVAATIGDNTYDYTGSISTWLTGGVGTEDLSIVVEDPDRVAEIARAALDAVGFDALLEEREALRDALQWYAAQGWRMADAIMAHDNQAALAVMKDIAMDDGSRARDALQEQTQ